MADDTSNSDNKIMDVQSPKSNPAVNDVIVPTETSDAAETSSPAAVAESAEEAPADQAATNDIFADVTDPQRRDEAAEPAERPASNPLAPELGNKTPHHHRSPVGVIVVAIIVLLALAGLTVYALTINKKPTASSASKATVAAPKAATTSDVDQTTSSIDSTLKQTDDTKDLSTTDLSDATLGL